MNWLRAKLRAWLGIEVLQDQLCLYGKSSESLCFAMNLLNEAAQAGTLTNEELVRQVDSLKDRMALLEKDNAGYSSVINSLMNQITEIGPPSKAIEERKALPHCL